MDFVHKTEITKIVRVRSSGYAANSVNKLGADYAAYVWRRRAGQRAESMLGTENSVEPSGRWNLGWQTLVYPATVRVCWDENPFIKVHQIDYSGVL